MCGIAGYVGTRELPVERIELCLREMHRRGPDHAGWTSIDGVDGRRTYLLSTRLDIIDLHDRANQPIAADGHTLVYNGELYNYLEIRAELESAGVEFATNSDTEVLLRALARGGTAALDRCEGMWAFALHDERDGSLILCRDRFGEKPLWLHRDATGLYFGSEAKAVAALLGRSLDPDLEQLFRYLVTGYRTLDADRRGFFGGLEQLPPATLLRIEADGAERAERYWEPRYLPDEGMTYEEAVAGVRDRVVRSVELRLRADVPVAFCMSGGVDSNSLIAVAKRLCGYDVHGFTVVNEDARYDERDAVEASVRELGLRHTAIPLERENFLERLRALVRYHDAPVATISYYAHWTLMAGVANHGYRVSVSGTGADELLTGYYDHHLAFLYEVRGDPVLHAQARASWEREILPLVRNPHLRNPDLFVADPGFREHLVLGADRFAGFLTNGYAAGFSERSYASSLLRNRMLNELRHEVVPVILREDDLNAMYFSIENRSPFLDRDLCEFCFRIPSRHLIRDGRAKAVLRDAMVGIAPDHVLETSRKVGFNAPVDGYLARDDPAVRAELLADAPIFEYVRRDRIRELLAKPELPNSESKFLFSFVNAKLFLEELAA